MPSFLFSSRVERILLISLFLVLCIWFEYICLRDYNLHRLFRPDQYENPFRRPSKSSSLHDHQDMTRSTIVFAGLARNVHTRIRKNIQNCVLLGSFFVAYKVILFENDSNDGTRQIIREMAVSNPNIQLIECKSNKDCRFDERDLYEYGLMNENRIDRMAFFRNVYLSIVYQKFPTYDYLCIVDMDMDGTIPIHGLRHALSCPFEWSCICANGRSGIPGTFGMLDSMYDAMALCLTESDVEASKRNNRSFRHLLGKYLRLMYMSHFDRGIGDGFVPVLSAFNGVAIYKLKDIHGMYYKKGYTCEHISLHDQMVHANKKIFIDLHFTLYFGRQGPRELKHFFV